jgi:FAD/FMN-containing dehydrogenase
VTAVHRRDAPVAFPGDEEFEAATQVFNLHAPLRPAAAVVARSVHQVRAAINYARSAGLSVQVHSTGHASANVRPMSGAVLIRTRLDGRVEVDPVRRVARIPAGATWGAVVEAAAGHGLAAPHGSSELVGAVGYLLRGGLSFYARRVGLAANAVRAIELVTADGEVRRVDAANDPQLFWALRGGGGGFGVVTGVEVGLFPATSVYTGATFWAATHAGELLDIWLKWTRNATWDATTSVRVLNLPAVPGVPAELSAGPVLTVDGAVLATTPAGLPAARDHAEGLLAPMRAVARPVLDTWQSATPAAVLGIHLEPSEPVAVTGDHMLLGDLGGDGAAALLRHALDMPSPLVSVGLRQLGGALAVPDPEGGALRHLDAAYAYSAAGVPADPATEAAIDDRLAELRAALRPWDTGRTAPTFVENLVQPQGHLDVDDVAAVDRVRLRVDPGGLFRGDVAPGTTMLI